MFDPYFIGEVDQSDVKVVSTSGDGACQTLDVILRLQGSYYALIMIPNRYEERDQIVIDRLKHVFNLNLIHVFGLKLKFVYNNGHQIETGWQEYLAYNRRCLSPKLQNIENLNEDRKIEFIMILLFRYILGIVSTKIDHILVTSDGLLSTCETRFSSAEMDERFSSQCVNFDHNCWNVARERLLKGVLLDNIRGVIMQVQHPVRELRGKSPKGKLSISSRRIMEIIELRLDVVRTYDLEPLKRSLNVIE